MAKRAPALTVDVQVTKKGPNGRPSAEVLVDSSVQLSQVAGLVQKYVTRDVDLLKKVGLRACAACISGMDIWIRHRFDEVIRVDLKQIG
jgi:hypothetical protein